MSSARLHRGIWTSSVVTCLSSFIAITTLSAWACSNSSSPTDIGPNFDVRVVNDGKPVVGLQIELSTVPPPPKKADDPEQESRTVAIVATRADGSSAFRSVRPGTYYVGVNHPASPLSVWIRVSQRPPKGSSKEISFDWPDSKFFPAQWASGFLNARVKTERGPLEDLVHPIFRPLVAAKLNLWTAVSYQLIGSQVTGDAGTFDFPGVPAGDYFLQIESEGFPNGYIPLRIDPSAARQRIDFSIDHGICGGLAVQWSKN